MSEHRFFRLLLYIFLVCAAVLLLFRFLLPVLLPFLIGFLLSQLAEPAVRLLQARGRLPRGAAAAVTMSALFLLLSLLLGLLLRVCAAELTRLSSRLPALLESLRAPLAALRDWLLRLAGRVPDGLGQALRDWVEELFSGTSSLIAQGSDLALSVASGIITRVPGIFLFLVTAIVSSFMFSAERETLLALLRSRIPASWKRKLTDLFGHLRRAVRGWLRAEVRLMGITFLLVSAGLLILGVDAPLLIGAVTAVVDALPVFGTGTVLIPWGIWCLLQGDTVLGAGLLVLYGIAAAVRTSLEPRLVGRQIGLHPLLALLSMYAGFRLFGVGGMILLPITAILARQFWVYGGFGAAD